MADASGIFEPVHAAHAIEHVVIGVQLVQPLNPSQIPGLKAQTHEAFKDSLPGVVDIRAMTFGAAPSHWGREPIAGFVRQSVARTGAIEDELTVDLNSITFKTSIYTRWKDVWARAKNAIGAVLVALPDGCKVGGANLQYTDKFIWKGDPKTCAPKELIRVDSPYVSPQVLHATDLWHAHTGMFESVDNGRVKRLIVVNLDCIDETSDATGLQRIVRITSAFTDLLGQPGFASEPIDGPSSIDFIYQTQENLHNEAKALFAKIVTSQVADRIALKAT